MKLIFAAATAAFAVCTCAHAAPATSVGLKPAQECTNAAGARGLTDRQMQVAMDACNTALSGDLSKQARAGTLVNRGLLQVAAHDDRGAVADFSAAINEDNKLSPAYVNRGTALLRAGRYAEARADFDQAIALNGSDLHVAYFNRGEAQEAAGNITAAYHDYRKAQELAPGFQPAALELARFQIAPRRLADNHG